MNVSLLSKRHLALGLMDRNLAALAFASMSYSVRDFVQMKF